MNDMSQEQNIPRPEIEQTPTTSRNSIRAAGKTVTSRLERLASAIKKGASKQLLLRASILSTALFPSDNIQNQNIHTPNILEPAPVSAPLPDFTQNYGLETIQTPMPIGSTETSSPPPTETPTPVLSPVPPLKPAPTNIPSAPETPTPTPTTVSTNKEIEKEQGNNILVLDITKDAFPNLEKYGLPNMSEEELKEKLGIKGDLTMQELIKKVPEDEKLQLAVLAHITKLHYGDHGKEVVRAMEEVDKFLGVKGTTPDLVSLPDIVEDFKVERDEIGNPTFWIELGSEELIKTISKSPQKFINLSLELGKVGIKFKIFTTARANPDAINPYDLKRVKSEWVKDEEGTYVEKGTYLLPDGTEIDQKEYDRLDDEYYKTKVVPREFIDFKPIDAYGKRGNPLESLGKMANVASNFPDKIFFAAARNPIKYDEDIWPDRPKIVGPREMLIQQGKWPSNLFMIGYWGLEYEGIKYPSGFGADYYINVEDLDRLGLSWGTSFATPVAEKAVSNYFSREDIEPTSDLVRQALDKYSVPQEGEAFWDSHMQKNYDEQIYKVIDLKQLSSSSGPEAAARTLDPQLLKTK